MMLPGMVMNLMFLHMCRCYMCVHTGACVCICVCKIDEMTHRRPRVTGKTQQEVLSFTVEAALNRSWCQRNP